MTGEVRALVDKRRRSLAGAQRDFAAGDYDLAVSRGYYAMFHLAVAALRTRGGEYRKHTAVIAAFREKFVTDGTLASDLHVALGRAFNERTISDYRYDQRVTEGAARRTLDDAGRFVDAVEVYLRRTV